MGSGFRKLWFATGVSNLGDGLTLVAGPLFAAQLTRDPVLVGGAVVAQRLPWLLVSLLAGAVTDRVDRRRLMVSTNTLRAVLLAAFSVAVATDTVGIWLLYVVLFLHGAAETVYDSATQAIIPGLVTRQQLERANGRLLTTTLLTNEVGGRAAGGLLFAAAAALPFAVNAATFAISAGAITAIAGAFQPSSESTEPTRIREDITEGLRWLWNHRVLRVLALLGGALNLMFTGLFSILVLFAQERLGLDAAGYGILLSVGAVGGVAGSLSASRLARFGPGRVTVAMIGIQAVLWLSIAATTSPLVAAALLVAGYFTVFAAGVFMASLRQTLVPDQLLGRVTSAARLLTFGTMPLGPLVMGAIAERYGIAAPYYAVGVVLLLLGLAVQPVLAPPGGLDLHPRN